jgi:hypothetical protein
MYLPDCFLPLLPPHWKLQKQQQQRQQRQQQQRLHHHVHLWRYHHHHHLHLKQQQQQKHSTTERENRKTKERVEQRDHAHHLVLIAKRTRMVFKIVKTSSHFMVMGRRSWIAANKQDVSEAKWYAFHADAHNGTLLKEKTAFTQTQIQSETDSRDVGRCHP